MFDQVSCDQVKVNIGMRNRNIIVQSFAASHSLRGMGVASYFLFEGKCLFVQNLKGGEYVLNLFIM